MNVLPWCRKKYIDYIHILCSCRSPLMETVLWLCPALLATPPLPPLPLPPPPLPTPPPPLLPPPPSPLLSPRILKQSSLLCAPLWEGYWLWRPFGSLLTCVPDCVGRVRVRRGRERRRGGGRGREGRHEPKWKRCPQLFFLLAWWLR